MKRPMISVVIPTFNRAKYLPLAIDSVLNQTFKDYEIIVVDDGSTDSTHEAMKPYFTEIQYICQKNSGVSSARNTGIRQAKGKWIAFLDSDDEWDHEYLSTQVLRINKYPHAVGHITNAITVLENGSKRSLFSETKFSAKFKNKEYLVLNKPFKTIIKYASWCTPALIVRKDVLLNAGLFDTTLSIAEDIDIVCRIALEGMLTICKKELVMVYRREESMASLSIKSFKERITRYHSFGKVFSSFLSSQRLTHLEKLILRIKLSENWRALGNAFLMSSQCKEARAFYKKSFFVFPSFRSSIKYLGTFLPFRLSTIFILKEGKTNFCIK